MNSRELYLRLLQRVRPYSRQFLGAIAALVLTSALEPLVPALLKPLLDGEFFQYGTLGSALVALALIGIYFMRGLAGYAGTAGMGWVAGKVVLDLRTRMFDRLLALPTSFFDHHPSGTLVSKQTYDVEMVTEAATYVLTTIVRDSIIILGLLGWIFYLNWKLATITFVIMPAVLAIVRVINKRLRHISRTIQQRYGGMTHVVQEAVEGNRIIKIFGGHDYERKRFFNVANQVRQFKFKQVAAAAAQAPLSTLVTVSGLAVIIFLTSQAVARGDMTIGGFASFLTAMGMLVSPVKRLTGVNSDLQRGLAAAESVFGLIDEQPEVDDGSLDIGRAEGRVAFEQVTFRYPGADKNAVEDFTLAIAPGETVALVGASGSGKSTIAALLPRFYDVTSGVIRLDGHDIRMLRLASLRANISMVSQDILLFNDTIAANIAYGCGREVTPEMIEQAARAAHALEFIEQLPEGFGSRIGDKGVLLSGGQRQRLAIARAILKDAPLLILDEATSALDAESERHVQAALDTLRSGRTTLVIAHRLSTIENADRIVVLEHGRIVETGGHAELLGHNGAYARLYRSRSEQGGGE